MNFDESQLSAFLDNELDPDDHLMVAWNVESSLATAQQLADLKSARDLVAGLGRPAIPLDLSSAVLADIARLTPQRRPLYVRVGLTAAMFGGVGALAASLILALLLLFPTLHDNPTSPALVSTPPTELRTDPIHPLPIARTLTPPVAPNLTASKPGGVQDRLETDLASLPAPVMPRFTNPTLPAASAPVVVAEGAGKVRSRQQNPPEAPVDPARAARISPTNVELPAEAIDAMLGNRRVLRALIVTDVLDQTTREVRSLIEHDPGRQPDFGRITLTQGIVIDPDQPGEAEVFSVVMPNANTADFLARLARDFPDVRVEAETTPALVTHLSEIGQVELIPDGPTRLGLPPREIRALVATKRAANQEHLSLPELEAAGFGTDPLADARQNQLRADLAPAQARKPKAKQAVGGITPHSGPVVAAGIDTAHESVTVLVWVARTSHR